MTTITSRPFFTTPEGAATLYILKNQAGMEVSVSDYGGTIVSILAPDRSGMLADVALGHDDYETYHNQKYYLGATVGRCCNRIGKGRFTLGGREYQVALNDNGKNHLHGGDKGFSDRLWSARAVDCAHGQALEISRTSPDGEEAYPGTLEVKVTFTLTGDNRLELRYEASSDADTLCNLTNHCYFNLAGHDAGSILDHQLKLYADFFTEADAESIPTGKTLPVAGTPMDFTGFHRLGERIGADYEPLRFGAGYDHNWVLREKGGKLALAAELYEEGSGRLLQVYTDLPCIQVYSGNFMDGSQRGKGGCFYPHRSGIALETQFAPDAVNHPEWASPVLHKGDTFEHTTVFAFTTK